MHVGFIPMPTGSHYQGLKLAILSGRRQPQNSCIFYVSLVIESGKEAMMAPSRAWKVWRGKGKPNSA